MADLDMLIFLPVLYLKLSTLLITGSGLRGYLKESAEYKGVASRRDW